MLICLTGRVTKQGKILTTGVGGVREEGDKVTFHWLAHSPNAAMPRAWPGQSGARSFQVSHVSVRPKFLPSFAAFLGTLAGR